MNPTALLASDIDRFGAVEWWMAAVAVILVLVAAVLAVAETAITRMTRARAQALVDQGVPGAGRLQGILANLERDLNGIYLAVNIVQTIQAGITGVLMARLLGPWGAVAGLLLNVVVLFTVAEAAPKTWALQNTERAALLAAPLVHGIGRLLRVPARVLIGVANVILPGKGLQKGPFVTEEELLALAEEAAEAGGIEESERELIASIIEFGDTVVREIMVPRTDMVAVAEDWRVADVLELALLNGLSRFPVYRESVDDVVGVVYAKDLVRAERDHRAGRPVAELARDAYYVPETKRVAELLSEMQVRRSHIAIVIDEYGGTAGLVTMEDVLEELVGEITDEFDTEEALVERQADGSLLVNAAINVDDLNEECELSLPEGNWDSVGGLVFARLGRVAVPGDAVEVEGYRLTVDRLVGRRITRIRVTPVPDMTENGGLPTEPASAEEATR